MSGIEQGEGVRTLRAIAGEIAREWPKMAANEHHPAHPYVDAMLRLEKVTDAYAAESGVNIVRYFLSNAAGWRGPVAQRVKAELKDMIGLK